MSHLARRDFLKVALGGLGLSLPGFLQASSTTPQARARSCIVLYCWGGMSHHETWDTKPDAPAEYRGEFKPIATAVPGIRVGEHMPRLAQHTDKLAIVRSMHHRCSAHGKGMYWNITGHPPPAPEVRRQPAAVAARLALPGRDGVAVPRRASGPADAVQVPYPLVDNNTLQAGDNAGFLGPTCDPIIIRPDGGRALGRRVARSRRHGLAAGPGIDSARLVARQNLARMLDQRLQAARRGSYDHFRQMACRHPLEPDGADRVQSRPRADQVREAYGDHLCGQSMLLARRLTEAGVPIVTVICAAGDLNGSAGDHWDTHGNNFNRLKRDLLPPLRSRLQRPARRSRTARPARRNAGCDAHGFRPHAAASTAQPGATITRICTPSSWPAAASAAARSMAVPTASAPSRAICRRPRRRTRHDLPGAGHPARFAPVRQDGPGVSAHRWSRTAAFLMRRSGPAHTVERVRATAPQQPERFATIDDLEREIDGQCSR